MMPHQDRLDGDADAAQADGHLQRDLGNETTHVIAKRNWYFQMFVCRVAPAAEYQAHPGAA
jgi:hypothetical protein